MLVYAYGAKKESMKEWCVMKTRFLQLLGQPMSREWLRSARK